MTTWAWLLVTAFAFLAGFLVAAILRSNDLVEMSDLEAVASWVPRGYRLHVRFHDGRWFASLRSASGAAPEIDAKAADSAAEALMLVRAALDARRSA